MHQEGVGRHWMGSGIGLRGCMAWLGGGGKECGCGWKHGRNGSMRVGSMPNAWGGAGWDGGGLVCTTPHRAVP
eukprot:11989902-Prorocentrum_lima.AAC.1